MWGAWLHPLLLWCVTLLLMVMSPASQWHLAGSLHDQMTWLGPTGNMKGFLRSVSFSSSSCGISSEDRYFLAERFRVACVLCTTGRYPPPLPSPAGDTIHYSKEWSPSYTFLDSCLCILCPLTEAQVFILGIVWSHHRRIAMCDYNITLYLCVCSFYP